VLLTFFDMSARTHYLHARQMLGRLLEWRVLPVINENDTATTDEIFFGDNDSGRRWLPCVKPGRRA
jgi:glutamate 5-kinase